MKVIRPEFSALFTEDATGGESEPQPFACDGPHTDSGTTDSICGVRAVGLDQIRRQRRTVPMILNAAFGTPRHGNSSLRAIAAVNVMRGWHPALRRIAGAVRPVAAHSTLTSWLIRSRPKILEDGLWRTRLAHVVAEILVYVARGVVRSK